MVATVGPVDLEIEKTGSDFTGYVWARDPKKIRSPNIVVSMHGATFTDVQERLTAWLKQFSVELYDALSVE